jgi:hypothetical protein
LLIEREDRRENWSRYGSVDSFFGVGVDAGERRGRCGC